MSRVTNPKTIAIIGASRGLGASLAQCYAQPGRVLHLAARNQTELDAIAAAVTVKCKRVTACAVDLTNDEDVVGWLTRLDQSGGVDLLIINAAIFGGSPALDQLEPADVTRDLIATNLTGAIICANTMGQLMKQRGYGQIALMCSLAARMPSADAATYSATKAGLSAFGRALRFDLAPHGVSVSVVHPGHIDTAQARQQSGSKPMMVTPDKAAKKIMRGLAAGRTDISFPFAARLLIFIHNLLPVSWQTRLAQASRFVVDNATPK
jgi:short-subunit dehydrogenase